MKKKSKAHKNLSIMFKCDSVPPYMILENSKDQSLGEFRCKWREYDFHLNSSELYSPWQISDEGCTKELKKAP